MIQFLAFIILLLVLLVIYRGAVMLLDRQASLGVRRAAYAISGLWMGLPLLLILAQSGWQVNKVGHEAWVAWVLMAVLPNVLFWIIIWVLKGFRTQ